MRSASYTQVFTMIDRLLEGQERIIVAIDGRCGAGKSTLASELQSHYNCAVIPADHFFLRPEQRSAQRLAIPGENIDHERLLEEVLVPLKQGKAFSYRPFDCSRMELGGPVAVEPGRVTVIEGSYCCHPELWDYYDLRIFVTVDLGEQLRRILVRNGSYAAVFREKWIPLEERYFTEFELERRCDLVMHI